MPATSTAVVPRSAATLPNSRLNPDVRLRLLTILVASLLPSRPRSDDAIAEAERVLKKLEERCL